MTKLEQCMRLIHAVDEKATLEFHINNDTFYVEAINGDKLRFAKGNAASSVEAAVDALHVKLGERVERLQAALDNFECSIGK
jgi:hypothetical protein